MASHICQPRKIELLAPAKNAEIAIEAIRHGADAVYMGASSHGARASAANSLDEIARVIDYAHKFNVRVYATVNTIIYENELTQVENLVKSLYRIGTDALIVQDMALLRLDIPPIALHASTQCDTRTVDKARFLSSIGFSQIVLPREMNLQEISEIHKAVPTPLEAFIHGALCVSYSGDCHASYAINGRSANRGECSQICRLPFDLTDSHGNILVKNKHLLSLRDLNRSASLLGMLEAGVSSFKIEGRLKDMAYVKNTVAAYRRLIDDILNANPDKYCRASSGETTLSFTPDLNKSFNRGYTDYFTLDASSLGSINTPKWQGEKIGTVTRNDGNRLTALLDKKLNNGDGITYLDKDDKFRGFRANRVDKNIISLTSPQPKLTPGTILFRNRDKQWDDQISGETATRTIIVDLTLRRLPDDRIALDISDRDGHYTTVTASDAIDGKARRPQEEARRKTLEKTGDTLFRVGDITDCLGDSFVPLSIISDLRRRATQSLERAILTTYPYDYRRQEDYTAKYPSSSPLTYHENVANHLAREFYESHGATVSQPAMEVVRQVEDKPVRVMTSRYCIRRQLGKCLRTQEGEKWKEPLYIVNDGIRFKLYFDCKNCIMHVDKI